MASLTPSSSHDTQTIENLLKTENTEQTLNFPMKSGSQINKTKMLIYLIYRGKFQGYISRTTHEQNDACYV